MFLFVSPLMIAFRYNGWYGGFQLGYDTSTAKLVNNNLALGYQGKDFTVHASV